MEKQTEKYSVKFIEEANYILIRTNGFLTKTYFQNVMKRNKSKCH